VPATDLGFPVRIVAAEAEADLTFMSEPHRQMRSIWLEVLALSSIRGGTPGERADVPAHDESGDRPCMCGIARTGAIKIFANQRLSAPTTDQHSRMAFHGNVRYRTDALTCAWY